MTSDCLGATCKTSHPHSHGHSCDSNCQACHGPVAVLQNLPSTKIEKDH